MDTPRPSIEAARREVRSDRARPPRTRMVGWFDPPQLARTGVDVIVSKTIGQHADHRIVEALTFAGVIDVHDFSSSSELWFDYAADTGDGWNSTYAVAHSLVEPELAVTHGGTTHTTRRGDILVLGGDECYPVASRAAYDRRLIRPLASASRDEDGSVRHVFAIPGNHDWYDSLVAFTRVFTKKARLGGWRTAQQRSYFALKLPHGWWMLGLDFQLVSDIDMPQLEYFRRIVDEHVAAGDRVILAVPEPYWVYQTLYSASAQHYRTSNVIELTQAIEAKARIRVHLAGDLHHFRHHVQGEGPSATHRVTAGGGGAFLHATHRPKVPSLADGSKLAAAFPSARLSSRIAYRNLLFLFINPRFGVAMAMIYLVTAWLTHADLAQALGKGLWPIVAAGWHAMLDNGVVGIWIALLWGVFFLFTDTHVRWYRLIGTTVHWMANLLALLCTAYAAVHLVPGENSVAVLARGAVVAAGGWVFGSVIMGLYLLVSHNVFGRHSCEAFSALRIPDWKHFLRFHIAADGKLTLYPIGIRRVPRRWKRSEDATRPQMWVADDPRATPPELIEAPVVVE